MYVFWKHWAHATTTKIFTHVTYNIKLHLLVKYLGGCCVCSIFPEAKTTKNMLNFAQNSENSSKGIFRVYCSHSNRWIFENYICFQQANLFNFQKMCWNLIYSMLYFWPNFEAKYRAYSTSPFNEILCTWDEVI